MSGVLFDDWFERKRLQHPTTIRVAREITETSRFVRVVLSGQPSGAFEYRSLVKWGDEADSYEAAVTDGILDELVASFGHLVADIRFTLHEAAGADPLDPNPQEFYLLARIAARKILEGNQLNTGAPIYRVP